LEKDPDADFASNAIAAAEVIAFSRGHGSKSLPDNGAMWVEEQEYTAPKEIADLAIEALRNILAKSELKTLWEETGGKAWRKPLKEKHEALIAKGRTKRHREDPKNGRRRLFRKAHSGLSLR